MMNNIRSGETDADIVCEAIGCVSKARNKIATKVGSKGATIFVLLCDSCKTKFTGGKRIE